MLKRFNAVNRVSVGLMTVLLGCGAPNEGLVPSSPVPDPLVPDALSPLTETATGWVAANSQSLALALPEPMLWKVRRVGTYFHASHADTRSELWVKRWRQGELTSAARCQTQSLLWRPKLAAPQTAPLRTTTLRVANDYHTEVNVHVWSDGETWRAQLTASGASIRDCFAYVYRTDAPRSPLGRAIVEQRANAMLSALRATRRLEPSALPRAEGP